MTAPDIHNKKPKIDCCRLRTDFRFNIHEDLFKMKTEYVARVNQVEKNLLILSTCFFILFISFQLDALQLDKDILRIIRDQLTKSLQNLSVNRNHPSLRSESK